MVKAVYSVSQKGLQEWLIQHISAFIMTIYTLGLVGFLMCHSELDYATWHGFFEPAWVKVATLIVFFLLLYHAWIGIWTVLTDYVKCSFIRLSSYVVVLLALFAFFIAAILILWGV